MFLIVNTCFSLPDMWEAEDLALVFSLILVILQFYLIILKIILESLIGKMNERQII